MGASYIAQHKIQLLYTWMHWRCYWPPCHVCLHYWHRAPFCICDLKFQCFFLLQWVIHLYESIHVLPKFIYLSTCNMYHSQKYWNSTYIFGIENYSHFSLQLWFHVMWHIAGYWPAIYPMTIWVDGYMKGFIGDKVVSWKSYFMFIFRLVGARKTSLIARFIGSTWGPPGVTRTQVGPM